MGTAVCPCVCVHGGGCVQGGSCVTQQASQPLWPAVQTVLVPFWFPKTEAAELAAWAVLQCTRLFSREVFWIE